MSSNDPRGSSSGSHLIHAPSNRGRIAIFIDGNNLFHAARSAGVEIDYAKLLAQLRGEDPLLRAFFYTGVDQQAERQQGFLLWMRRNGYRVVQKELKTFPDGTKKANLDVEIAVDMLSLADKYDTAILVSGDEDFTYALNVIAYKGVRVEVAGFRANTSPRLIDVADRFHELDSIVADISKSPSKRDSQQTEALRLSGEWSSSPEQAVSETSGEQRETSAVMTAEVSLLTEQPTQPPIQGDLPERFEGALDSQDDRNAPEAGAPVITENNVIVGTLQSGDYPAVAPVDWEASEPPRPQDKEAAQASANGKRDPVARETSEAERL
ncbi:MAG: hypothetical protein CFK52_07935 [Chloracidobacterium sp. CP2_5A]|nr:MAG: hypothetical protein CFK52_07935 [Chloracidobacterium sp. CP2_5A]